MHSYLDLNEGPNPGGLIGPSREKTLIGNVLYVLKKIQLPFLYDVARLKQWIIQLRTSRISLLPAMPMFWIWTPPPAVLLAASGEMPVGRRLPARRAPRRRSASVGIARWSIQEGIRRARDQ